jgi:hypothetical protein
MYSQLDVWRSTANCNQDIAVVPQQQQQQQQNEFDSRSLMDLMSIMDGDSTGSFQPVNPPPAYPGTPISDDVGSQSINTDDYLMEDEGTFIPEFLCLVFIVLYLSHLNFVIYSEFRSRFVFK